MTLFSRREVALILLCSGAAAAAQAAPDYGEVTSRERAEQLVAEGRLVRILLFPAEFGGEEIPPNMTYVPPAVAAVREQLIGTLTRYIEDGLIDRMTVEPEYRGGSLVPIRIRFNATHSSRSGAFSPVLEIWP